jgi:hypothetical protein
MKKITALLDGASIKTSEPTRMIITDIMMKRLFVSGPGLSIMSAIIGCRIADVTFATARSTPTSVLLKPFDRRYTAA